MKQNSKKIFFLLAIILLLTTGCTKTLKDSNKKVVTNPETGQRRSAARHKGGVPCYL